MDGQPRLYLEGRDHDPKGVFWGQKFEARVRDRLGVLVFLELSNGKSAVLDAGDHAAATLIVGQKINVEITAEARADKSPKARLCDDLNGSISDIKSRIVRLSRLLISDAMLNISENIELLDEAEEGALSVQHSLNNGAKMWVEPTRAFVAVDVDSGERPLSRAQQKTLNFEALKALGAKLQLMGLGGLVIADIIGKRIDPEAAKAAVLDGFLAESGLIQAGGAGRFGTYEFTRAWRTTPLNDPLMWPIRAARNLLWQAASECENRPGRRVTIAAHQGVIDEIRLCLKGSLDPLRPMLDLTVAPKPEVILHD